MRILTWISLGLMMTTSTGCGLDQEFRDALPTAKEVSLDVPGAMQRAFGLDGVAESALLNQTSEFYQFTWGTSLSINTSTVALITLIRLIVLNPSTSGTATSRTWGPHTPGGLDPLTYRLVVSRLGPKHYDFSLEARSKSAAVDADFLPLLDGEITRGATVNTGIGTMTLHFDHARQLVPTKCEQGKIAFAFDNTTNVATNDVTLTQFANANNNGLNCKDELPVDATYHFEQQKTGGAGEFSFVVNANIHKAKESKPLRENLSITSQWRADGQGRADVEISGGEVSLDLGALSLGSKVTATQCWSANYLTVYETSAPAQLDLIATAGDPSECAF